MHAYIEPKQLYALMTNDASFYCTEGHENVSEWACIRIQEASLSQEEISVLFLAKER